VRGEDAAERWAHLYGLRAVQARLAVERRVAGGEQELLRSRMATSSAPASRSTVISGLGCDRLVSMKLR
jgi:hypothetical protein